MGPGQIVLHACHQRGREEVPEGGAENGVMSENLPTFAKDIILQIQEAEWIQNMPVPKHHIVKPLKTIES